MKRKAIGYIVVYSSTADFSDYAWPQNLSGDDKAPDNALESIGAGDRVVMFATRKAAREAIEATHHFHKAHWPNSDDERKYMRIVPVEAYRHDQD